MLTDMSLEVIINDDIRKAMLARDKDTLEALRAVKSALLLAKTEKGGDGNIDENHEIKILQKMVKHRSETAEIYLSQNRKDLADAELFQAEIIRRYLPQPLSDEELTIIVRGIIAETGAQSVKDMGRVMSAASAKLAGKADNKAIADKVKSLLGI